MKKHRERDGLLPRMEARKRKEGFTYRYHPVGKKPINLGHDRIVAIRKVLDLLRGRRRWDDRAALGAIPGDARLAALFAVHPQRLQAMQRAAARNVR
ncbi:hypothetical protein [Burkholderia cepacia]|uniref:hypothetical protein n=1 Tax=Burkholderia cepacia TaxID=292 RepID=UPI0012D88BAF|nr:hypothetical protein [Burkholderia cepacia]